MVRGSFNRWLLLYLLVGELLVLSAIVIEVGPPADPKAWPTYVLARALFAGITSLLMILLYVVLSGLLAALAVDQIGWDQIERCFGYMHEDERFSNATNLDTIRILAETSTATIWGSITVLGILLGFAIPFMLSEGMKSLPVAGQVLVLLAGAVSGFAASLQVIVANSNTVIARAVSLWQEDPNEGRRIAEAYARRKPLWRRVLLSGSGNKGKEP